MPDVQVFPNPETRDYLNIAETANRSRPAVFPRRFASSDLVNSDSSIVGR